MPAQLAVMHHTCGRAQALESFVQVPEDKVFLQQLLQPVAHRGTITTPGFHWNKVPVCTCLYVCSLACARVCMCVCVCVCARALLVVQGVRGDAGMDGVRAILPASLMSWVPPSGQLPCAVSSLSLWLHFSSSASSPQRFHRLIGPVSKLDSPEAFALRGRMWQGSC